MQTEVGKLLQTRPHHFLCNIVEIEKDPENILQVLKERSKK